MCKQHQSNMHDEKTRRKMGILGHIYHDVKIAYDSLRGMRAKAAHQRWRWGRRSVVPPMQSPSFRNTHGVHNDPQDAHPSKFVLLQPPSLFSLPLSLRWRFSVSPLLPLSPSLSFFSLTPPSLRCYRGACISFLFFFSFWKDSWIFDVRHTHTGAAPCLTVIFLTNTCLFCNLCINYLMNHVTSWSGGGGQGVGWGGGCQYASPFVGPIRTSAVWCRTLS